MQRAFVLSKLMAGSARFVFLSLTFVCFAPAHAETVAGYIRDIPRESMTARELRHAKVAERRAGVILMAHRGAGTLATENTLEAYAAAMDYGANGCEVDLRRTADGVFVLFHDDMLDRLTDGFGKVEDISYAELLSLYPQLIHGTSTSATRPPTFAALLTLARQRAMLLFLDVKESGHEDEIAQILDEADAWDHVVAINMETASKLLKNPKLKLLSFKGGVFENRRDLDPAAVKEALAKPGQVLMLEDPRLAARELRRVPYKPVPLPKGIVAEWNKTFSQSSASTTNFIPAEYLRSLQKHINPDSTKELLSLLRVDDLNERSEPRGDADYQRRRTERIVERAWAAERLGQIKNKNKQLVELLELQVQHSSLHFDWLFQGLDGGAAARALGRLHATESAPALIATFRRVDPASAKVRNPEWTNSPLSFVDWRKMSILFALGELHCDPSKMFLQEYVAMNGAEASALSIPQFEEATKALLRQQITRSELLDLLRSPNSAVRGAAILECLDHPTRERTSALREAAPWALDLPRAKR